MKDLSTSIADKIKNLRRAKGLNQQTLANRCGYTRSYISLVESGKKVPAVATMAKIADALGTRVGALFEDDDVFLSPDMLPQRKDDLEKLAKKSASKFSAYSYIPLAREKLNKIMDPFLIWIFPGKKGTKPFIHHGQEFNYVIEGKLKFTFGDEDYIYSAGDCFYCESSIAHNMEALEGRPVCLLSVVTAFGDVPKAGIVE